MYGASHPTKLSAAYPLPYLYIGMPWGGGFAVDIELLVHLGFWEHFILLSYCTDLLYLWILLLFICHASLPFGLGYTSYHMLGRCGIRSLYVFSFPLFYCLFFWKVWQPDFVGMLTKTCFHSCLCLCNYSCWYLEMRMDWVVCLYEKNKVGGLIFDLSWRS